MERYENAIEVKEITKSYPAFCLNQVSFTVPKGCIMGFIGQNGAGKTTTLRSILHITNIKSGEVRMFDQDFFENEIEIKKRIAVVFDETPFHGSLTARDLNVIFGGIYPEWNKDTFYSYLQYFEIREDQKIAAYSKGLKMKLQLACALSHNAELLILDEPTAGLDPVVREEVLQILLKYMEDGEHSILMSTHITSELDKIADMVTLIDHGSILFSERVDTLLEQHGLIKCAQEDLNRLDPEDIISVRTNRFGVEVMVKDREKAANVMPEAIIDRVNLEDIMVFYVERFRKERADESGKLTTL
ncbi:MAG: ABC transporter ATP-binding protein [Lachnospiraceae bacterium]|nr:ABC transporter ATP-binding protein [Lachnospiraceae bacterium]